MGVTRMAIERDGPFTVNTDDGAGTISSLELIYGNDNLHIFYGKGSYEGPVIKKRLDGECVLVLRTEFTTGPDGKPMATNQMDIFLKVENATLGLIAKTIQPIVGSTADHNFVESLKFVQRLNETTEKNGPGVGQMSYRLDISDEVRQKFIESADLVFERALKFETMPANRPDAIPQWVKPGLNGPEEVSPEYANPIPGDVSRPRSGAYPQTSQNQLPPIIRYGGNQVPESGQSMAVSSHSLETSASQAAELRMPHRYGYQAPSYQHPQFLNDAGLQVPHWNSQPPNSYQADMNATIPPASVWR
jgi:hypothetical protein